MQRESYHGRRGSSGTGQAAADGARSQRRLGSRNITHLTHGRRPHEPPEHDVADSLDDLEDERGRVTGTFWGDEEDAFGDDGDREADVGGDSPTKRAAMATSRRKSTLDLDEDFEALLLEKSQMEPPDRRQQAAVVTNKAVPGRDCMPDDLGEPVGSESFAAKVLREQAHRDELNKFVDKTDGEGRNSWTNDVKKTTEKDVNGTLDRVRSKLAAVKTMRKSFLDDGGGLGTDTPTTSRSGAGSMMFSPLPTLPAEQKA